MYWGNPVNPTYLASPADLATYLAGSKIVMPDNALAFLAVGTRMVLEASAGSFYSVDTTTGLATDTGVAAALTSATVIQAGAWIALGLDPLTGGAITQKIKSSARLGSGGYTSADAADASAARLQASKSLVPEAARVLHLANLLGAGPWTFG